ncbi:hypothetical protein BofuT4_P031720.1 [Botrytis cinerea T4]|uniref:Uncharacterized protein n=1 Tax=Botryotinia fuckeliana (strain T4) TaxID=999810 RepID=G2Y9M0_BOTF4|nr:hypothetical protein BofuT4_P031720.1 [Botrytis cinerea T4]
MGLGVLQGTVQPYETSTLPLPPFFFFSSSNIQLSILRLGLCIELAGFNVRFILNDASIISTATSSLLLEDVGIRWVPFLSATPEDD